jgi:streptogramin lyase
MMPDEAARDPHTLIFDADEENIWFTVQGGNMMGRLNIESRKVDLIKSRTPRSRPYGIKQAPDGSIWVVLFGSNKLAHIDPETLEHDEIELPRAGARPRRGKRGLYRMADAPGQRRTALRHGSRCERQPVDGGDRCTAERVRGLQPRNGIVFQCD